MSFAVFGTAGTEDFNYLEMRRLDRALTTPHRLAVFQGSHVWLSSELAIEAVEWLQLQAMKSGAYPKDPKFIDDLFARRTAALAASSDVSALDSLVSDFTGLKDVAQFEARAAELHKDKHVRQALKKELTDESEEERQTREILTLEMGLMNQAERNASLLQLRDAWRRLAAAANSADDSIERRRARRITRGLLLDVGQRIKDPEYLSVLEQYRTPHSPPK